MAKEHVDALISARDRRVELEAPVSGCFGQWRKEMIEVQTTIHAIDDALLDETEQTTDA